MKRLQNSPRFSLAGSSIGCRRSGRRRFLSSRVRLLAFAFPFATGLGAARARAGSKGTFNGIDQVSSKGSLAVKCALFNGS